MRALLLTLGALSAPIGAVPAAAQADAQVAAQPGDFEADDALIRSASMFALLSPRQASGQVLCLGRDERKGVVLTGISLGGVSEATATGDSVIAVVWLRGGQRPSAADRALAERLGRSLFLFDASGGTMWEVGRRGGMMQYRQVARKKSEWKRWQ